MSSRIQSVALSLLNWCLPPRCPSCRVAVSAPGLLCGACFADVHPVTDPQCLHCGFPFDWEDPSHLSGSTESLVCGACSAHMPAYDHVRAAALYEGVIRRLILALKAGDGSAAPLLARLMGQAVTNLYGQSNANDPILLVPVPLHWRRLAARRFNQAQILAQYLLKDPTLCDRVSFRPELLIRKKATPKQKGLGLKARHRNVRAAFGVPPGQRHRVKGQHILLVDDVFTTGATLEACAKCLKKAGAVRVDAVVSARVNIARNPET